MESDELEVERQSLGDLLIVREITEEEYDWEMSRLAAEAAGGK